MLGADGQELRQRAVPNPVSQPGVYQEESILARRAKMREEDRSPPNMWLFAGLIVGWCFVCYLGWFFVLRHDDHWVIDEIHRGHVANVQHFLHEHHQLGLLNKLDEVGASHRVPVRCGAFPLLPHRTAPAAHVPPKAPCVRAHGQEHHIFPWRRVCAQFCSHAVHPCVALSRK